MISIIIPTYNRQKMLKDAIDSILQQIDCPYDIIVIDDCSSDNTYELVKSYPSITYIRNTCNKGPGYNRKRGFKLAKGEYIIFMDDDDYYIDNSFFKKAEKKMEEDKSLAFVSGNAFLRYEPQTDLVDSPINISGFIKRIDYLENFQYKYSKPYSTFTTVFRKEALEKAHLDTMNMVNDSSIYLRALLIGNAFVFKDCIGVYRIHKHNISKSLDYNFLISNLFEKNYIYEKINKDICNPKQWWYQQYRLTFLYFLGTNPSFLAKTKVLLWGIEKCHNSIPLFLFITKQAIKSLITK